jgi:hypothetical protein
MGALLIKLNLNMNRTLIKGHTHLAAILKYYASLKHTPNTNEPPLILLI